MRALIIGGGIAGSAAAIAFRLAGVDAVVFETYEKGRSDVAGSCLTIATNGLDALQVLGLQDQVLSAGYPSPTRFFVGSGNRFLGEIPIGPSRSDGTVTQALKRAVMCRIMQEEAVRRGARVEYGKRLIHAEALASGGIAARFADDTQDAGDFLVGADGIHSRVRHIVDPAAAKPRYAGFGNVGGFSRVEITENAPGTCRMFYWPSCFFGYVTSPAGETCWFANPPRARELSQDELSAMTTERWQRTLLEEYKLDVSPAAEIIRGTTGRIVASNQYDMPSVKTWHNDSMIIIGDAAHAPASSTGQGASLAIEDAVILAKCLRDMPNTVEAFAAYERLRRTRTEKVVALGQQANRTKSSAKTTKALSDDQLARVIERNSRAEFWESQSWLFSYHIDWDEAVTAAELPVVTG